MQVSGNRGRAREANDIRAKNGGYNLLLDKVFDNNADRYEECGMILMLGNNVYMEYGAMNMNRMPGGDSKQSLGNNQSVQKLKTQNSQPGTSKGNTGGGGASTGAGGQSQVGVQFGQENETGMVTYRRVQGGTGNKSSQMRITIDSEGNVHISNKNANLNLSIDNGEHSQYYTKYNRPGADIYEFEVPKWFDDMVQEYTIPQTGYQSNPLNQGGSVPKLTDTGTPGTSVEFPSPWIEWIEGYARNGRIRSGGN